MVWAAIGRVVLADLIKNHMTYLKALTTKLREVLAAPAEIEEMIRQIDALYICLELLLEQVVAEDSIINTNASEEAGRIEKFLENCTKNLTIVNDMIRKHVSRLVDRRKTWSDTFLRMYKSFSWTSQKGNIQDLIQAIKNDLQMVNQITSAIQSKSLAALQNALSQISEDTHYIRQTVDELKDGMQRIQELLMGMAQGSCNSLYGMFGSSMSTDNDDDDSDDLPPAYVQNTDPNAEFISQDRFRRAATMRWQLVPQDEPSTLHVTTAEFLWRMAKVTADVHPWDNKIRSTSRYKDGTCDKALYNIVCHLMAIAETRAKWSTISIASWLTTGAWYLSWARFQLSYVVQNKVQGTEMEIYAAFVKVYWIILTIDQHPQKPLLQDAGQTYQELEQYENLIAALHNEIKNAENTLGRESLQKIVMALRQSLGKIWEREHNAGPFTDHAVGSYASRILESALPSQSYIKPASNLFLGQWEDLCPRTCITLPKPHEHVPGQPAIFACMCNMSQHLQTLSQFYIMRCSYAENMNATTLEIHNVSSTSSPGRNIAVAVECPSVEATKTLKMRLEAVVARLSSHEDTEMVWPLSSIHGPKILRLTRSAFDNGKSGTPFMKALVSPRLDHWREIEVPKQKVRYVDEVVQCEKPPTIWSGFWSFLGYSPEMENVSQRKEVRETVIEKKKVPDTELNDYFTPKQKPPDYTEALSISPMSIAIHNQRQGLKSTIHIISATSCFEIWFELGSGVQVERKHNSLTSILVTIPANLKSEIIQSSKNIELLLEFCNPKSLEDFQRAMLVAKAHEELNNRDHWLSPGPSHNKVVILWQGRISACAEDIVKSMHNTGRRFLILVGKEHNGKKMVRAGMVWDSSNMSSVFVFKVRTDKELTIPSPTSERTFWLKILNGKAGTSTADGMLQIDFVTPDDAMEVRGICEDLAIIYQKPLQALKFTPTKKMGIHVSSKSQTACVVDTAVLDILARPSAGLPAAYQLWLHQNDQWLKLVSPPPRSAAARRVWTPSVLQIRKAELQPASVLGPAGDATPSPPLLWKGDFELCFRQPGDASQANAALG